MTGYPVHRIHKHRGGVGLLFSRQWTNTDEQGISQENSSMSLHHVVTDSQSPTFFSPGPNIMIKKPSGDPLQHLLAGRGGRNAGPSMRVKPEGSGQSYIRTDLVIGLLKQIFSAASTGKDAI